MSREELPFRTAKEPERLAVRSTAAEVFGFTPEKGKEYVYKEVGPGSRILNWYLGETLGEKIVSMKKAYEVLKRHLGDRVVPTHFLIAKDGKGAPCIMLAQEKIKGKTLDEITAEQLPEGLSPAQQWNLKQSFFGVSPDVIRQREEIALKLEEAEKDPDLIELFRAGKLVSMREGRFLSEEAMYRENQIVDENGRVRIVDW